MTDSHSLCDALQDLHQCVRCGCTRDEANMTFLYPNLGWACDDQNAGTTCAMQLEYRGYVRG